MAVEVYESVNIVFALVLLRDFVDLEIVLRVRPKQWDSLGSLIQM